MFLEISTGVSGWIVIWENRHELYVFTALVTGARLKLMHYNIHGMTNFEMEMCM